jgi:multiple sugar transport system substrate-binding protein
LVGLATAALGAPLLAACGGSGATSTGAGPRTGTTTAGSSTPVGGSNGSQGGKTLNIIASSDYQPLIENFAQQYKARSGNTVNLTAQAYNQTHDKIVSGLASGGASYDIVVVDTVWTAEFAAANFIAPLDDRITKEVQDQLVPAALVSRSYKGKIYQWPLFTMKFLYYNEKMLKDAGFSDAPKTWDELITQSKAIQQQGIAKFGTAWAFAQAEGLICDYVLMLNDFGGKYQDAQGKWILNQGAGVKTLEFMANTVTQDKIASPSSATLDDRTNRNLFLGGEIPFLVNWTSAYKQFTDPASSKVAADVRVGLIPGIKETGVISSSTTGGSGFGLAAKSTNKDAAWDFVKTMIIDEEAQRRWLKDANQIPTYKKLYDDPQLLKDYPHFAQMRKQMDYGFGRPDLPWYGEWTQTMQLELNRALTGQKSSQQALDDAMKEINRLQGENK